MKNYALSIDCGTRGIRAIIFDQKGNELAAYEKEYSGYYHLEPGYCEASGAMFWNDFCEVVHRMKLEEPERFSEIAGMTVACQRDTATILDEEGEALRDFIVWMDRRELDRPIPAPGVWDSLFKIAGKTEFVSSFNKGTHGHWIMVNEPELWNKAKYYCLLSTYYFGKLTGKVVDCRSDIAGHLPFNYQKKEWADAKEIITKVVLIEKEKMPPLFDSCEILGTITKKAAEATGLPEDLPVIGSGTDKGCETIGVGCLTPDTASVSLGTQATVEITTDEYFELVNFYPPFPSVNPQSYNPEITVYRGFWMMKWFVENFAQTEKMLCETRGEHVLAYLDRKLQDVPAGAGGLILHPYWGMESFKPEAKGSIIGFSEETDKYHIYRAIVEGIGYALREGMEFIEKKSGVEIRRVALSGGGASSEVVCQLYADLFGRETYCVQTPSTTGLGAAMAVFTGLGVYPDLKTAGDNMVRCEKSWQPDSENAALYDRLYQDVYKPAYARYQPLYKALEKIHIKVRHEK